MIEFPNTIDDPLYSYNNRTTGYSDRTFNNGVTDGRTTGLDYTSNTNAQTFLSSTFRTSTDTVGSTTFSSFTDIGTATTIAHSGSASGSTAHGTATFLTFTGTTSFSALTTTTGTSATTGNVYIVSIDAYGYTYNNVTSTNSTVIRTSATTTTVSGRASTTGSRKTAFPYIVDSVFWFEATKPEVLWLGTAAFSTTGPLSNIAQSFTADHTMSASTNLYSSSGAIPTSGTTFPTTSFSNSHSTSFSFVSNTDFAGWALKTVTPRTVRQLWFGTFTVTADTVAVFNSYLTASASSSFSTSGTVRGLATFTTTISQKTTVSKTAYTSFVDNAAAADLAPDYSYYLGAGFRTTTIAASSSTSVAFSSWSDSIPDFSVVSAATDRTINVGLSSTRWGPHYSVLSPILTTQTSECYLPTDVSGFAPFSTAGQLVNFYRNVAVTMDSNLAPYAFSIPALSFAMQNHASIIHQYDDTFLLSWVNATNAGYGDFATAKFASNILQVSLYDPGVTTDFIVGQLTVGFESAFALAAESGNSISIPAPLFAGGCQSVTDQPATRLLFSGARAATSLDSAGGSSIATTNRTARTISDTIATDVLVFESVIPIYSIKDTTTFFSFGGAITESKFQTYTYSS